MPQGSGSGELSDVELKAFDLLIAQLEESGQTSFTGTDAFITIITPVARTVVPVTRITIKVTPVIIEGADRSETISEAEAIRLLADRGELTLDELVEARKRLAA